MDRRIGEVFQVEGRTYKTEARTENDGVCEGCALSEQNCLILKIKNSFGCCVMDDGTELIFKDITEEKRNKND